MHIYTCIYASVYCFGMADARAANVCSRPTVLHSRTQYSHELKIRRIMNSTSIHNRSAEAWAEKMCSRPTVCTHELNIITNSKSIKSPTQNQFAVGLRRHEQRCVLPTDRICTHELNIITNLKSIQSRTQNQYITGLRRQEHLPARAREAPLQRLSVTDYLHSACVEFVRIDPTQI